MPGFFESESFDDTDAERSARELIDPKGLVDYDQAYFLRRRAELTSDDATANEVLSDCWLYSDKRFIHIKEKEFEAFNLAIAAVGKFIEASQRAERMRNQIQEGLAPLLEANYQIAHQPQITTADFGLKPLESSE